MKLYTTISLKTEENQIDYKSQLLILGSCFAENIGSKLDYFKFQSQQNPFGILFQPLAMETLISKAIRKETYTEEDIFFLNEQWHCFDTHSDLSDPYKEILLEKLNHALDLTNKQIKKSTHIVITLGTAWVYQNLKIDAAVANCHKVPQKEFSKKLLSVEEIKKSLKNTIQSIQSVNQNVQYIFTISPVRHLKDGFVENQRSKSHLIAAVHELIETSNFSSHISYFESYELMMDELRDYRFYESDMIHPSALAINYIWKKFVSVWIAPNALSVMEKVSVIQKGSLHRPFNAKSDQHQNFLKSLEKKITYLQEEYPFIKF